MKIVLIALLLSVGGAKYAAADNLPVNPWANNSHSVKISNASEKSRTETEKPVETPQWVVDRVNRVRSNNERMKAEYEAQRKAEIIAAQKQAEEEEKAKNNNENGGFLDGISEFFGDGNNTPAQPQPQTTSVDDDFAAQAKELMQGYDDLKRKTEKSVNKLKRNFNSLTNINIEKAVDDTLKSLQ